MRRARKFLHLTPPEQRLLLHAWWLVAAVRLGLWLVPFAWLRQWAARATRVRTRRRSSPPVERVAWAVVVTSRAVPRATCLTQALAGQVLLARYGYPARLHIGVARAGAGGLEAHAWLESGERIVIGDRELERYTHLLALEGRRG